MPGVATLLVDSSESLTSRRMSQRRKATSTTRSLVRPTERQPMKPWMLDRLEEGKIEGLEWIDEENGMFRIPWKHASGQAWKSTDACLFKMWAKHTGRISKYKESKRWKANFRCALNSLPDVKEHTAPGNKKGPNAFKVYQFLKFKSFREERHRKYQADEDDSCDSDDMEEDDCVPKHAREEVVETMTEDDFEDDLVTSTNNVKENDHKSETNDKKKRKRKSTPKSEKTKHAKRKNAPAEKIKNRKPRSGTNGREVVTTTARTEFPTSLVDSTDLEQQKNVVLVKHYGGCALTLRRADRLSTCTITSRSDSLDSAVSDSDDDVKSLLSNASLMSDEEVVELIFESNVFGDIDTLCALPWPIKYEDSGFDSSGFSSVADTASDSNVQIPIPNLEICVDIEEEKLNPNGGLDLRTNENQMEKKLFTIPNTPPIPDNVSPIQSLNPLPACLETNKTDEDMEALNSPIPTSVACFDMEEEEDSLIFTNKY